MKAKINALALSEVYTTEEALRVLGLPARDSYLLYRERGRGNLTLSFKRAGRRFWLKQEVDGLSRAETPLVLERAGLFADLLDLNQMRGLLGRANGRKSVSKEHVYSLSDLREGPLSTVEVDGLRFWLASGVRRFIKEGRSNGNYPFKRGRPAR